MYALLLLFVNLLEGRKHRIGATSPVAFEGKEGHLGAYCIACMRTYTLKVSLYEAPAFGAIEDCTAFEKQRVLTEWQILRIENAVREWYVKPLKGSLYDAIRTAFEKQETSS